MKITVEYIEALKASLDEINNTHLSEIEILKDGDKVEIDSEIIKKWVLSGLSNIDFLLLELYEKNLEEIFYKENNEI